MRTRILSCMLALLVLGSLGLMSCGKDGDDDWASENIAGKVVTAIITSGSPVLATTGSFTMTFNTDGTYVIVPLTPATVGNSQGTYGYEKMGGDTGEITLLDTTLGMTMKIILTYTDEAAGTYSASVTTPGLAGQQTGTFTEE